MTASEKVVRPALRWHGGKWLLGPWVIEHLPPHRIYVEPFGGAASVLLRKPRAYAEVYNDLDDDVVNLFSVLRDPSTAHALTDALRLTPFARKEFRLSYELTGDPIEKARRLVIRSFMGFGSDAPNRNVRAGFRAAGNRAGNTSAHDWMNYPESLAAVVARLRGVVIECKPAMEVIQHQDQQDAVFYLDPPYLPETRSNKSRRGKLKYHAYRHEMTADDHELLLAEIQGLQGMVVLSGYHSKLYDKYLKRWTRSERKALADGAQPRVEVLWLNPAAHAALEQGRQQMRMAL